MSRGSVTKAVIPAAGLGTRFDEGRDDIGKELDHLRATVEIAIDRDDLGPELRAFLRELSARRSFDD